MKQGILYKNDQGQYTLDHDYVLTYGERLDLFDEDLNTWVGGSVQIDGNKEYYFVDDEEFLVIYLHEGLSVKVDNE